MDLDLGDILKLPPPANDEPDDIQRVVAVMVEMQTGINALTDILVSQKAEIEALKRKVARLEAVTAPARIVKPGDVKWPN